MPTYDYECDACGHRFELLQGMRERAKRKCPECKKNKLQRIVGAGAGLIFKGSGFYSTEYRSSSYKAGEKADAAKTETGGASGGCGMNPATGVCSKTGCPNPKE